MAKIPQLKKLLSSEIEERAKAKRLKPIINTTIYVSEQKLKNFRKACEVTQQSANEILEVLMEIYAEVVTGK